MSRSYRKQPVWKDHNKGMKQKANRKVRRALNRDMDLQLPRKQYRKFFPTYDICDYRSLVERDFEKFYQKEIQAWHKRRLLPYWIDEKFPDRKEEYREWMKCYRGK